MLNLDTHLFVFALAGELSEKEIALLLKTRWSISEIVLWELAKLVQLDRLQMDLRSPNFIRCLKAVHIWPIDLQVSLQSTSLDIRSDPADEIIAATSIVHNIPLITRDLKLLRSKQIPLAK